MLQLWNLQTYKFMLRCTFYRWLQCGMGQSRLHVKWMALWAGEPKKPWVSCAPMHVQVAYSYVEHCSQMSWPFLLELLKVRVDQNGKSTVFGSSFLLDSLLTISLALVWSFKIWLVLLVDGHNFDLCIAQLFNQIRSFMCLRSAMYHYIEYDKNSGIWYMCTLGYGSVIGVDDPQVDKSQATGFSFSSVRAADVVVALARALDCLVCPLTIFVLSNRTDLTYVGRETLFRNFWRLNWDFHGFLQKKNPELWTNLIKNCMTKDLSWDANCVEAYEGAYNSIVPT